MKKVLIGGLMYILLFAGAKENIVGTAGDDVGKEQWKNKIMADPGARAVIKTPKITTIVAINSIPDTEKRDKNDDRLSYEKQEIVVTHVLIREVLLEDDNDYHLVIQDQNSNHLIAEIPNPDKVIPGDQTEFTAEYRAAREMMLKHAADFQHFDYEIRGVLFRDHPHGQTGKADNNIEIHPVLEIKPMNKLNF